MYHCYTEFFIIHVFSQSLRDPQIMCKIIKRSINSNSIFLLFQLNMLIVFYCYTLLNTIIKYNKFSGYRDLLMPLRTVSMGKFRK